MTKIRRDVDTVMKEHMETSICNPPFVPMSRVEVEATLHISRSKIYEMINPESPRYDQSFPKPLRWGNRSVMWKQSEIFEWMLTRERAHNIDEEA